MIKIMVDSASDCTWKDAIADDIIPQTVSIGGVDYQAGEDLTADQFYELLTATEEFPKTSQPSPEVFAKIFARAKEDGDEVIYLALSSALSGTYQSAVIAKEMVDYDGIYIVDTKLVTYMIGVLAEYVYWQAMNRVPAAQIVEECEALKSRIKVLAGVDTLEYLYKGGRLSRTSAAVGSLAGIKPIITVTEAGTIGVAGKAIGVPRACQTILTKLKDSELDENFPLYTLYTYGDENPDAFDKKLMEAGYTITERKQIGPAIGSHAGPGVYGVIYVTK